jgi:CRP/FNR family transcriptional regulator, cyclic AMP receptor protein
VRKVLYVLGQLSDLDVEWMVRAGTRRHLHDGEIIIEEGQHIPSLYILLSGQLGVEVAGVGQMRPLQSGEIVGEMSFVDSAPTSATVKAQGEVMVLELRKQDVEAKIASDADFGLRFYRAIAMFLADRLRTVLRIKAAGGPTLGSAAVQEDELDEKLLDSVSLAGDRFDRMMRELSRMR